MNTFEIAVVNAFRAMPDEEILGIAKQHIGVAGAFQSLEAIPRAGRAGKTAAVAEGAKPGVRKAAPRAKQVPPKRVAPAKSSGEKRNADALASQMTDILAAVKATPGQGAEQIAKMLGFTSSKALALPMRKLIAEEKKVRTEGQKRATKYYPV